jgi:hypothetical protein
MSRVKTAVTRSWNADGPMTAAGLLMLAALVASVAGLWLDPRTIGGAPAWLKPAKFAISTAIYMFTLAWVFSYLPDWTRLRRLVGRVTAGIMVLEVAIIDTQAWRGVGSHFNVGTPLDAVLFSIMGLAILAQTLASAAVAVALWRQTFADRALGWALRLGLTITIAGALTGGLMTRPTEAQMAGVRATGRMPLAGAHTVGAPDGGPGLAGTGWSLEHGDLRVPHFLGLHALQALPILAVAFARRRWTESTRVRLVAVASVSYVSLFGLLLWQAIRGQSLVNPDPMMLTAILGWAAVTLAAVVVTTMRRELAHVRPVGC